MKIVTLTLNPALDASTSTEMLNRKENCVARSQLMSQAVEASTSHGQSKFSAGNHWPFMLPVVQRVIKFV